MRDGSEKGFLHSNIEDLETSLELKSQVVGLGSVASYQGSQVSWDEALTARRSTFRR